MPSGGSTILLLSLLVLATTILALDDDDTCVFTIYIRTGSVWKGGTDSVISLRLYDGYGRAAVIDDVVSWGGLMGPFHDYFERGNLDIFTGRGPCLSGDVCAMNLTSDGTGDHHGWYCNYVEVTMSGTHKVCSGRKFTVDQWLARDTPPYELSAIRNYCSDFVRSGRR
ncbi:PREDICTED: PLAT domain-containing protein 3 [Tarenaya hassleriana]|uniref:PLAT domain-containing protein 3 n=1 Tax=Tarenaya hassleriana TaxID=28532 RepID=UPI00053C81D8|nr:PREDICTED: PLAT domain-containing protein 3 [Tarenaya hassleriana]